MTELEAIGKEIDSRPEIQELLEAAGEADPESILQAIDFLRLRKEQEAGKSDL